MFATITGQDVPESPAAAVDLEPIAQAGPSKSYPSGPVYDFKLSPRIVEHTDARELPSDLAGNFWRSARWSPDGSCLLTTNEDRTIRLIDTPQERSSLASRSIPCPDAILSAVWYPFAAASTETFCFAASIRGCPVRLVDADSGRIRATYPIVDHRERFVAPHSMAFNPSATKLYCGHENAIEVIDIASPGYDTAERLKTRSNKREKGGQLGIISALAFSPDYSGTYAAGSFKGSVSLYAEETDGAVGHLDGVVGGGVTQLAFHPLSPQHLFVASRRSTHVQVYDLRNPSASFMRYERLASTNQRLAIDVDSWGRWLAAGDETGVVRVWDISTMSSEVPVFAQKLHDDAVSSVQLHPLRPIVMTAAGSRAFQQPRGDDSDEGSASDGETTSSASQSSDDDSDHEDESASPSAVSSESVDPEILMDPHHKAAPGKDTSPPAASPAPKSGGTAQHRPRDRRLCLWSFASDT